MIRIINDMAMFVGYVVLGSNAIVGGVVITMLWMDGVRDWFRRRREERDRREVALWLPDEVTPRRQRARLYSEVG